MKKILALTIILCFSLLSVKAQLANTKWKGTIKIATKNGLAPTGVILLFTTDTLSVIYDNGFVPDVMTYTETNGKVTFKKISGGVPCDTTALMVASYQVKNDQLWIKAIQDECKVRGQGDISAPFDRMK
jgi:hypothetical protein